MTFTQTYNEHVSKDISLLINEGTGRMIKLIQRVSQGTETYMINQERNGGVDWLKLKKKTKTPCLMNCKAIQLYPDQSSQF